MSWLLRYRCPGQTSVIMPLPRLLILIVVLATGGLLAAQTPAPSASPPPNPLIKQRADPHVYRHSDGYYYFMGTVPEYDRLELRRAPTIEGLATPEPETIWKKNTTGIIG